MAKQTIFLGTTDNDGTGTDLKAGGDIINDNFDELYIGTETVDATEKTTPVDADVMPIQDSAASNVKKKVTWANIKATLKTYFDTLYVALSGNQTVNGVKTFGSFPVTPSSAPTTDYQVANKKYVDDNAGGGASIDYVPAAIAWDNVSSGVNPKYSSMQQLTGITVPTPVIIKVSSTYAIQCWTNTTNSWTGAVLITGTNGSLLSDSSNYYNEIVLLPSLYYGFKAPSISGTVTLTIISMNDLTTIDTITFTHEGGP